MCRFAGSSLACLFLSCSLAGGQDAHARWAISSRAPRRPCTALPASGSPSPAVKLSFLICCELEDK